MCCPNCCLEQNGPIDGNLAQLKAEISFIESMMQKLSSRRLHLHHEANKLSSIAKLPTDVLIEIFQVTCEFTGNPLLFGGICKDWRQIAWAAPLLWSRVFVNVLKRPSQVDLLREWLLRAQSAPLSIYLTWDEECETTLASSVRTVFELLLTRAEYWKIFDCVLPTPVAEYRDMFQHAEFPLLTSLSLSSTTCPPFPTMVLVAPRLEYIELSRHDLRECDLEAFPLEQLCFFNTEDAFITDVQGLALLRSARALQECSFDSLDIKGSTSSASPTLHTQLELLHVVDPSHFFLDNLTLPKLRVLTVDDSNSSFIGDSLCATISSLVSRSSCHLERLNLMYDRPFNDDIVITLLEALPSLNHLDLASFDQPDQSEGLTDKLVSRLRPLDHATCLLPRLTSFEYHGAVSCNRRLLVEMLSERWHRSSGSEGGEGVSRLIRANIVAYSRFHRGLDVCADINMLVDEGMEVEIRL